MYYTELKPSKTLVLGPPRGGFTLLISVLNILQRELISSGDMVREMLNGFAPTASDYVTSRIFEFFEKHIDMEDLFYSKEFQTLTGGPKWLCGDHELCVRKYLGIRNLGDFTFVIYLPRFVLRSDEVVHSHEHPGKWVTDRDFEEYIKFAAIRNPIDIIHSSVHSINALASEYMQRGGIRNQHDIRRELALNKLSDPILMDGLIAYLKRYLEDFISSADKFDHIMKWEDLIQKPEKTIVGIGKSAGFEITAQYAAKVWGKLAYRNLQSHHKHNFRKGIEDDWKSGMVNEHLEVFKAHGFDHYLKELGYGKIEFFDEKNYTAFQKKMANQLKRGTIYEYQGDPNLHIFAFNKTNFIPSVSSTRFKALARNGGVQIERAAFENEDLLIGFMDSVGPAVSHVANFLAELGTALIRYDVGEKDSLKRVGDVYKKRFATWIRSKEMPEFDRVISRMEKAAQTHGPPILLHSHKKYNIVKMGEAFYGIPQRLGPMDLNAVDADSIPEIIKRKTVLDVEKEIECVGSKYGRLQWVREKWKDIFLLNQ